MKPSTISQISLEGEDELLSLIYQLDNLAQQSHSNNDPSSCREETFEELSNSSKKQIARTLIRNDRRILNEQKSEKYLNKVLLKEQKAELYRQKTLGNDQISFRILHESTNHFKIVTVDKSCNLIQLKDHCRDVLQLSDTSFQLYFQSVEIPDGQISSIPSGATLILRLMPEFLENTPTFINTNYLSNDLTLNLSNSRANLPMCQEEIRQEFLAAVERNPVVVLVGETGCGKSTQVPQLILDHFQTDVNIVCTQPRRIAAISIAERVASERNQSCGDVVGYQVRLQANYGPQTKILYCTTGILLKKLQDPSYLQTLTHIIIDEVHERQVETDFLMAVLRSQRRKQQPHLKLILMSATVHSELITSYFSPCALIQVPGRMFPVDEFYLEDVNELVRAGQLYQAGMRDIPVIENSVTVSLDDRINSEETQKFHRLPEEQIAEFIIRLIQRENFRKAQTDSLATDEGEAILVFLPGIQSIEKLHKILRSRQILLSLHATVYILHSSLSPSQQRRVFNRTLPGEWKIVLSTNIAESSVTIDDITHVVDTGLVREMTFDPIGQLSTLSTINCSRSSLIQRKGRAGRVKKGTCWRLFPRDWMSSCQLKEYPIPEIQRVSLEDVCLQCVYLNLGNPDVFLSTCIQPPSLDQINHAISTLLDIGAIVRSNETLEDDEQQKQGLHYEMTPLGLHLVRLPLDVKLGKMLIYSCLFNCVDPILTVAASLGNKSPLLYPLDNKEEAINAHARFSTHNHSSFTVPIHQSSQLSKNPYFPYSDHLSVIRMFDQWSFLFSTQGRDAAFEFCKRNYLSFAALEDILDIREQFRVYLERSNLIPEISHESSSLPHKNYSEDLVRCALCAGLFPRVVRVCMVQKFSKNKGTKSTKYTQKILDQNDDELTIHPNSLLCKYTKHLLGRNPDEISRKELFLVYHKKIASPHPTLFDLSSISPLALILFGQSFSEIAKGSHRTRVIVNGWIHLEISELHAAIVRRIQMEIDDLLISMVTNLQPDSQIAKKQELINSLLSRILSHDLCH